jgi:hypothetical protein
MIIAGRSEADAACANFTAAWVGRRAECRRGAKDRRANITALVTTSPPSR